MLSAQGASLHIERRAFGHEARRIVGGDPHECDAVGVADLVLRRDLIDPAREEIDPYRLLERIAAPLEETSRVVSESPGRPLCGSSAASYSAVFPPTRSLQTIFPFSQKTKSGSPLRLRYSKSASEGSVVETFFSATRVRLALNTDTMFWIA